MENQPPANPPPGWLSRFFLSNSIFGALAVLVIVVAGIMVYLGLVKENFPDLAIPQALVTIDWPGADPLNVEQQITEKVERKLKGLKGLKRLRSASVAEAALIAVEFRVEAGIPESMQELRDGLDKALPDLPKGAKKPVVTQMSVNLTPILSVNVSGDLPPQVLALGARRLKQAMERVAGVRKVELSGQRKEVVHVRLMPHRLLAVGLSPEQVRNAIVQNHVDAPLGEFQGESFGAQFRLLARFREASDLLKLPVARIGNLPIKLAEVAEVRRDLDQLKVATSLSFRGEEFRPTVTLDALRSPGLDTLKVIADLKAAVERFDQGPEKPAGLRLSVTSDESEPIQANLRSVFDNGWQAMLVVFAVLLLALGLREALVAGLAVPVTFLASLALLPLLGHTMNQLVVVGMVLALGLLVDNFILVMEGMHEFLARGQKPWAAVAATFRTYAGPAFSGTLTTILAMLPLAFIGGVDGKFIRVIPVTASICLVMSFLVAMLVALPLSAPIMKRARLSPGLIDRLTERAQRRFRPWLEHAVLNRRWKLWVWIFAAAGLFSLAVYLAGGIKVIMYPEEDCRTLGITVELPPGTPLKRSQEVAGFLGQVLRKKDFLESVVVLAGKKSPLAKNSLAEELTPSTGTHLVGLSCTFTPKAERGGRLSFTYLEGLRAELEEALAQVHPGAVMTFHYSPSGPTPEDPVQLVLGGPDLMVLKDYAGQVSLALGRVPGAVDVRNNLGASRYDLVLKPRREMLDFYGLTAEDVNSQIYRALEGEEVGDIPTEPGQEEIKIRLSYLWKSRGLDPGGPRTVSELISIPVHNAKGEAVSILSLVDVVEGEAPVALTHEDARRTVVVSCKLAGRTAAEVGQDLLGIIRKLPPPENVSWRLGGEAESSAEAFGSAGQVSVVAVFLVYAVMVLQFGSFRQPFVIMLSLPMAFIGVVAAFRLTGLPFSFPAMIGLISLAGIAVNDAIVLVDTTNSLRAEGEKLITAAARGSAERLRPVIITSVTTVAGLTPMALSDPMWRPLCLAIIGGITTSTAITLVLVPAFYVLILGRPAPAEV